MSEGVTLAYYERAAPHYTASTAQMHVRFLDPFLDLLEPGSRILELGCGCGRDAARMAQRGFAVDATDGAAAMVRKTRERTGLAARLMRFDELNAAGEYGAVWAHASLLHARRAALPSILHSIARALVPGGYHFANFKLPDAENPEEGRDLLGRWTNLPEADWLAETYRAACFELVDTERYAGKACDGTQRDWLALTVRKP